MSNDPQTIQAVVTIACDHLQRIKSSHRLVSSQDHLVAQNWPSGGQAQLAHGLLFEAARREAILCMLILLQKDEDWLVQVHDMPEKERVQHLRELSSKVLNTMAKTLALVVERAVQESYQEMVTPLEQPPDA